MQLDPARYQTDIARRMAEIFNMLLWVLGRAPRLLRPEPLLGLGVHMLRQAVFRLERLTLRWKSGKLRIYKPRDRNPPAAPEPAPEPPPKLRAPSRRYWLPAIVQQVMQVAPALTALMDNPETRALIAAAPQAGRIFRPLCRMFGIDIPEHLRLPKPAPRPRPARRGAPRRGGCHRAARR